MKATSITAHELSFMNSGVDSAGKKFRLNPKDVKIKGTSESVTIIDCVRENGDKSFYYQDSTPKKKIIVHYTMGYLKGDIASLTKDKVSVSFVLGRSGNIFNLFDTKYWSYHLGPGTVGGNTAMSKECIGIEISNIGPLKKIGDNLVTTYSDSDIYCGLDETQFYTKLPNKYRGYDYYAKFTENQYTNLVKLIKYLCGQHNIPKKFLDAAERYNVLSVPKFTGFTGIATHVNCRTDKTDIGPAFEWNRVIEDVG